MSKGKELVNLCRQASSCWDDDAKTHGPNEQRAQELAEAMNVMRDELGQVALKVCQNSHQGHLLRVPPMEVRMKPPR